MSSKCRRIEPDQPLNKILLKNVTKYNDGFIEIGEEKILMPLRYLDIADEVENFQVRDSDVFVVTHPRTGTTWTQEMIWMISNLDYSKEKHRLEVRFPFLE